MTAGTTNFPTSLDSHTGASPLGMGEVNNQAYTKATASHTNSVTTITVASTAKFASKGYIVVKREIISYTGTTATTFTGCTRGVGGTTADAYLTGTKVEHVVVAANHNDLAAGLVAVETAMGARLRYLTRKNRVINGDMRVCQRTTLGSSDDTFTLDRWTVLMEAANGCVVTQETSDVPTDGSKYAAKLTVGSGEDNKFGLATYLEFRDIADLRGKTISLQAKLKATAAITDVRMAVLEWTSTADSVTSDVAGTWGSAGTNPALASNWAYLGTPANLSPTTSWATYRVEGLTVGASANNLAVFIWCEDETTTVTTDYLLITDVQLEEGPTCSGFERRHYAQELALCQRYLQRIGGVSSAVVFASLGSATANNQAEFGPLLRAPMRTASPSLTYTAGDWAVYYRAGGNTITSLSILYSTSESVWLRAALTGTPLVADAAVALGPYTGGSYSPLLFSAEL
mgnify:FL=1